MSTWEESLRSYKNLDTSWSTRNSNRLLETRWPSKDRWKIFYFVQSHFLPRSKNQTLRFLKFFYPKELDAMIMLVTPVRDHLIWDGINKKCGFSIAIISFMLDVLPNLKANVQSVLTSSRHFVSPYDLLFVLHLITLLLDMSRNYYFID